MDWSALRSFLELSRHGSLSAAARALRISQPTLSRRLAQLESDLAVTLFLRSSHGLTLTAAGERLLPIAERMQEAASRVDDALAQGHDRVGGVVRVTVPEPLMLTDRLLEALLPLRASHPELIVEVGVDNRLLELSKREVDIAIRNREPSDDSLTVQALDKHPWYLYAAPGYLDSRPPLSSLEELTGHDLLLFESEHNAGYARWLERHGLAPRVVFRTNSFGALLRAARAGWGTTLLPAEAAERDPGLRRALTGEPVVQTPLWMVTHAELSCSPRVRAVFELLARSLGAS